MGGDFRGRPGLRGEHEPELVVDDTARSCGSARGRQNATPKSDQYVSTHRVGLLMSLAPHKLEDT